MKKIKFQKKLSLNKEAIAKLNLHQMDQVKGGLAAGPSAYRCSADGAGCSIVCWSAPAKC